MLQVIIREEDKTIFARERYDHIILPTLPILYMAPLSLVFGTLIRNRVA
jgi:hypothetical protein